MGNTQVSSAPRAGARGRRLGHAGCAWACVRLCLRVRVRPMRTHGLCLRALRMRTNAYTRACMHRTCTWVLAVPPTVVDGVPVAVLPVVAAAHAVPVVPAAPGHPGAAGAPGSGAAPTLLPSSRRLCGSRRRGTRTGPSAAREEYLNHHCMLKVTAGIFL